MVRVLESEIDQKNQMGIDENVSSDEEERTAQGDAKSEEVQVEAVELGITAELLLHPFNNAVQALWLCERLKEELRAEIIYVSGSPEGTVIKVSIRNPVSIVDFLKAMSEVAEAWEEPRADINPLVAANQYTARARGERQENRVVCVSLKPS